VGATRSYDYGDEVLVVAKMTEAPKLAVGAGNHRPERQRLRAAATPPRQSRTTSTSASSR
jgi:hypothetical protein